MASWFPNLHELVQKTPIFGLKLWHLLAIAAAAAIVLLFVLIILCLSPRRRRRRRSLPSPPPRDADEPLKHRLPDSLRIKAVEIGGAVCGDVKIDVSGVDRRLGVMEKGTMTTSGSTFGSGPGASFGCGVSSSEAVDLGWGCCFSIRELREATGGFVDENVIGNGAYGVVYHGVLEDGTEVAVKNLMNTKGEVEKDFRVELEAIGRVKHKNLVGLLGYCVEGECRLLVYEYLSNGDLGHWLHGDLGEVSPLNWETRMKIIIGTAKGLAYLHEGLEPKVVHRDVKSSNILLDHHWNPKVSDFGLAKLLGSGRTYVTTRVMGTLGYVAPEYAGTGMLTERSDVYSFGILMMEIISGRIPYDQSRPPAEEKLVDWLKALVFERRTEEFIDPKMPEKPSPKVLKRTLLVALQCVDPEAQKRPTMGHVVHMLEMDDMLTHNDRRFRRETSSVQSSGRSVDDYDKSLV